MAAFITRYCRIRESVLFWVRGWNLVTRFYKVPTTLRQAGVSSSRTSNWCIYKLVSERGFEQVKKIASETGGF